MLQNGVKFNKITIYGSPLLCIGINYRIMVEGEWNLTLQLTIVII